MPVTTVLTALAAGPKLEEIRLSLQSYEYKVKVDDIRELLTKAPAQLKAFRCTVFCRQDAQFLTNNRHTIATIDRVARDRGIQLHVTVGVVMEQVEEIKAQLKHFSDWLTIF